MISKQIIKSIIPLLCLILVFMACEETPLPEETMGEVVFYAKGNLATNQLDVEAGINDYYMASSYQAEDNGLLVFEGTFNRPNCTDCGEELRVSVRDSRILRIGESPDMDASLATGSYDYFSATSLSDIYVVDFESERTGIAALDSASWEFGDGNTSMSLNPQHQYINPTDLQPQVCLRTVDANGCVSFICNQILLDSAACKVDFSYSIDENTGFVTFRDQSEGVPPLQHRWDFGDGFGASLGNPGYYFGSVGSFNVCLTIKDAQGCQKTLCKNIGTDPASCNSNFTYDVSQASGPTAPQYSHVLVQWTDENGKVYRSDLEEQPSISRFEILSSSAYQPNEQGISTRKLDLRFQCKLYAEDGTNIDLDISEAVMALGHP